MGSPQRGSAVSKAYLERHLAHHRSSSFRASPGDEQSRLSDLALSSPSPTWQGGDHRLALQSDRSTASAGAAGCIAPQRSQLLAESCYTLHRPLARESRHIYAVYPRHSREQCRLVDPRHTYTGASCKPVCPTMDAFRSTHRCLLDSHTSYFPVNTQMYRCITRMQIIQFSNACTRLQPIKLDV
ncbi:hypothetical protein UY3_04413 [Chelonia mydas]|uniref:Uncharacterized protein n=1 Tax=Chelonia mydas TaxID=8469 RepID=M7C1X4_CHEMY|nr:hypothetical protein UY3_04413 [Chelonia mydas]